jgi:16S rRNA (guanine1207-N2)-methyltransferase
VTPGEHYFSADPVGPQRIRRITARLAGRDVEVETSGGVFSTDRVDLGTAVLLREVPEPPADGDLLDLGCGWGPIALTLALRSPAARVWAVDVNPRAVDLTAGNARRLGLDGVRACTPEEVPADIRFTAIWSNPPIRVGKDTLHALLRRWLPRLDGDGRAHLVVQRHLGADSLHRWIAEEFAPALSVRRMGSAKGYRVIEVARTER